MGVDKMGLDEMGVDEMGVDEMGGHRNQTDPCMHADNVEGTCKYTWHDT